MQRPRGEGGEKSLLCDPGSGILLLILTGGTRRKKGDDVKKWDGETRKKWQWLPQPAPRVSMRACILFWLRLFVPFPVTKRSFAAFDAFSFCVFAPEKLRE